MTAEELRQIKAEIAAERAWMDESGWDEGVTDADEVREHFGWSWVS